MAEHQQLFGLNHFRHTACRGRLTQQLRVFRVSELVLLGFQCYCSEQKEKKNVLKSEQSDSRTSDTSIVLIGF